MVILLLVRFNKVIDYGGTERPYVIADTGGFKRCTLLVVVAEQNFVVGAGKVGVVGRGCVVVVTVHFESFVHQPLRPLTDEKLSHTFALLEVVGVFEKWVDAVCDAHLVDFCKVLAIFFPHTFQNTGLFVIGDGKQLELVGCVGVFEELDDKKVKQHGVLMWIEHINEILAFFPLNATC